MLSAQIILMIIVVQLWFSSLYKLFIEALRKYPVADVIPRKSLSAYTFRKCEVVIPKDQLVVIPVYAIHHDPEIYPKPEIFDPERFLNQAAPSEQSVFYLPFGYGLRNCIGTYMRYSIQ